MDRREEILQAATALFIQYGIKKTTLTDIAKKCGLRKTALYYYFKNKDEIIRKMIEHEIKKMMKNVAAEIEKAPTIHAKIRSYIETRLRSLQDKKPFLKLFEKEGIPVKRQNFLFKLKKEFTEFDFKTLKEILSSEEAKQKYNIESVDLLIYMIMGVTYGLTHTAIFQDEDFNIEDVIEQSLKIIVQGIERRRE